MADYKRSCSREECAMPMRTDCAHFRSRTFPNGESVSSCELGLAPDAPWRCPDNCPAFERRLVDAVGWHGADAFEQQKPEDDPDFDGAADVLGETEQIL